MVKLVSNSVKKSIQLVNIDENYLNPISLATWRQRWNLWVLTIDVILRHCCLFTAERPFDLPRESETCFTLKLNPGSIIEYAHKGVFLSLISSHIISSHLAIFVLLLTCFFMSSCLLCPAFGPFYTVSHEKQCLQCFDAVGWVAGRAFGL